MLSLHKWINKQKIVWLCDVIDILPEKQINIIYENAFELLKESEKKFDKYELFQVINNKFIAENKLDCIYWDILCLSENDISIELLKKNIDKINWVILSRNSKAMDILKENQDKINWELFSLNVGIFTYEIME